MTTIITNDAALVPALSFSKKKSGKPTMRATAKQTICRFVRLKATSFLSLINPLVRVHTPYRKPPFCQSSMLFLVSFPHVSQPAVSCLAKSSIRGMSPMRATILSRVMSGFLLCCSMGEIMIDEYPPTCALGVPVWQADRFPHFPASKIPSRKTMCRIFIEFQPYKGGGLIGKAQA